MLQPARATKFAFPDCKRSCFPHSLRLSVSLKIATDSPCFFILVPECSLSTLCHTEHNPVSMRLQIVFASKPQHFHLQQGTLWFLVRPSWGIIEKNTKVSLKAFPNRVILLNKDLEAAEMAWWAKAFGKRV